VTVPTPMLQVEVAAVAVGLAPLELVQRVQQAACTVGQL
jgi:hypothetical protein